MANLAMRLPGTQFSADNLDLSWPLGGEREVKSVPDEGMSLRIKLRIAEGNIVIVDDEPTEVLGSQAREYRLLTGAEARAHMAEPAGPVTRVVYHPATPEDEREYQLEVQEVQTESDRFIETQREQAEADQAAHAEIGRRQSEAEGLPTPVETTEVTPSESKASDEVAVEPVVTPPAKSVATPSSTAPKPAAAKASAKPVATKASAPKPSTSKTTTAK